MWVSPYIHQSRMVFSLFVSQWWKIISQLLRSCDILFIADQYGQSSLLKVRNTPSLMVVTKEEYLIPHSQLDFLGKTGSIGKLTRPRVFKLQCYVEFQGNLVATFRFIVCEMLLYPQQPSSTCPFWILGFLILTKIFWSEPHCFSKMTTLVL